MPLKTPAARHDWLWTLTDPQLRALACQRKVKAWSKKSKRSLISTLEVIDGVEIPVEASVRA